MKPLLQSACWLWGLSARQKAGALKSEPVQIPAGLRSHGTRRGTATTHARRSPSCEDSLRIKRALETLRLVEVGETCVCDLRWCNRLHWLGCARAHSRTEPRLGAVAFIQT